MKTSSSSSKIWTPGIHLNGNALCGTRTVRRLGDGGRQETHVQQDIQTSHFIMQQPTLFIIIIYYYYYSIHAARHRTHACYQLIEFSGAMRRWRCNNSNNNNQKKKKNVNDRRLLTNFPHNYHSRRRWMQLFIDLLSAQILDHAHNLLKFH